MAPKRKKTESPGRDKLREWLRGKNRRNIADDIGISRFGLERYLSGLARPNQDNAFLIEQITSGAVLSADWASYQVRGDTKTA